MVHVFDNHKAMAMAQHDNDKGCHLSSVMLWNTHTWHGVWSIGRVSVRVKNKRVTTYRSAGGRGLRVHVNLDLWSMVHATHVLPASDSDRSGARGHKMGLGRMGG